MQYVKKCFIKNVFKKVTSNGKAVIKSGTNYVMITFRKEKTSNFKIVDCVKTFIADSKNVDEA